MRRSWRAMCAASSTLALRANRILPLAMALMLVAVFSALVGGTASAATVPPIVVPGNPNCNDVPGDDGVRTDLIAAVRVEPVESGDFQFTGPDGTVRTITLANVEETSFDWSSTLTMDVVIVKGGPRANVYIYDDENEPITELLADTGLSAPEGLGLSHVLFCFDPERTIDLLAGDPENPGYSGDRGPADQALLHAPHGVFETGTPDSLYFADTTNNAIRKIDGEGIITTVAGTGVATGSIDGEGGDPSDDLGDGGPATAATLFGPRDVFVDGDGVLYIADTENCRVRIVDLEGVIKTVAGNGNCGFGGDDGPATDAQLNRPSGVAVDDFGGIFIADTENCRVRRVSFGVITTAAGTGECGFGGDGGAGSNALLNRPHDVYFFMSDKDLLIADTDNHRIRRFDTLARHITTFAGTGTAGYNGDEVPAIDAQLNGPEAIAANTDVVLIADTQNHRIRAVDAVTEIITTIMGDGTPGSGGDFGPAAVAQLNLPSGVAIGSEIVGDTGNNTIRISGEGAAGPPGRNRFRTTVSCAVGSVSSLDWALPVLLLGLILGRKQLGALFFRLRAVHELGERESGVGGAQAQWPRNSSQRQSRAGP